MNKKEYDNLKANFLRAFANVPQPLRTEIIAVVKSDTFTWLTAKEEIVRNNKSAEKILDLLKTIKVI